METTVVTPALLISILSGGLISALGGYFKTKFKTVNPQVMVTLAALLIGAGYTLFTLLVPSEVQTAIADYVWGSLASAVLIYEWFWKNFNKTKK